MSPPRDWPESPPAWDHPSIWVRDGRLIVAVSQPNPWLLNDEIESLNEFAGEYGFRFKISPPIMASGLFNVRSAIAAQVRQFLIRDRRLPNHGRSAAET